MTSTLTYLSLTVCDSNVFLGLAYDKLRKLDESEKAYRLAIEVKPKEPSAWQGLVSLYETLGEQKLDEYRNATLQLAEIFMEVYVLGSGLYQ